LLGLGILTGELVAHVTVQGNLPTYPDYKISKPTLKALMGVLTIHAADPNLHGRHLSTEGKLERSAIEAIRVFEQLDPEVAAVITPPSQNGEVPFTYEELSVILKWFRNNHNLIKEANPMRDPFSKIFGDMTQRIDGRYKFDHVADEKTDPHLITIADLLDIAKPPVEFHSYIDSENVITESNARLTILAHLAILGRIQHYPEGDDYIQSQELQDAIGTVLKLNMHLASRGRPQLENLAEVVEFVIRETNAKIK
jgi:hypothetical protein